ncbi:MAG: 16S rRNA (adenine(1518)-N(6)/adenine(1519)-N(6))-dimethyltransferase RsmA [Caulobacteraceae bacterium]
MTFDDLPPLREALALERVRADKRFGQHFLLDLNVCRRIARLAGVGAGDTVLEVGPGPGGLTRALLETGARVVAVEKDARFSRMLEALTQAAEGRLTIVSADALAVDEISLVGATAPVVANLPYNVGTPLLIKWLTGPFRPRSMTLMFQKEVARRVVAGPGGGDFGRLAVLAQSLCEARTVMELPARAFTPPPKVDSAVVRLDPLSDRPPDARIVAIQTLAKAAFGQRRKMLRSALRDLGGAALCADAGIDPDARAETISVVGFTRLAQAWMARGGSSL